MPVYKLMDEMPYDEYVKWISFFSKRPVGWRDDRRTAMLLKAQGVKASETELFPSLKAIASESEKSQEPDRAVPKGKFLDLMMRAKGGDSKISKAGAIVDNESNA